MALLHIRDRSEWTPTLLRNGTAFTLSPGPSRTVQVRPATDVTNEPQLVRSCIDDNETWVLLTGTDSVQVNGERCAGACHVLEDQDEIRLADAGACFLSLAESAVVVPFPAPDRTVTCPRCTLVLRDGWPAVRCFACGYYHHEDDGPRPQDARYTDPDGLRCWSYSRMGCANCGHRAPLDEADAWSPAEL